MLDVFEYVNARGGLTVYDLDDDVWNIHPSNPAYEGWNRPGVQEAVAALARKAKMVTTATRALAKKMNAFNRDVRVLPNMLPDDYWPTQPKLPDGRGPLVIGWAGSATHSEDFKLIAGVLSQVLERCEHAEVWLAGAQPGWLEPHDRLRYVPTVPLQQYAQLLSSFDIAIAPLWDSKFNQCKSDLKVLEYSMIGLPVVASRVASYAASVRHGETGMLASNPKDWLRCLSRLVEDATLRERIGLSARRFAESRLMSRNVAAYQRAYGLVEPQGMNDA